MPLINFPGDLPVVVKLQWRGETVANALDTAHSDFRYRIANESVTAFTINGLLGPASLAIPRTATAANRMYDQVRDAFVTSPVSGGVLDSLIDGGAGTTWTINLTFSYRNFFDVLLEQSTRTDADLHNLANPNDSAAILGTFTRTVTGSNIRITYNSASANTATAVPCTLVARSVTPSAGPGLPPAVLLTFELDFLTGINAVRREIMRKLIAMDWSKLARYGQNTASPPAYVDIWEANVRRYLGNSTDMDRAERIRKAIVSRHLGKTPLQLATDLRNDIDLHIITANHWGELRESLATERHQRFISDLFGSLHQSAWLSSPVHFIRALSDELGLGLHQGAALVLQYGAGHCGEHALVSFSALKDIIDAPGSLVPCAVKGGNANIDHAFCVYNLPVTEAIVTLAASPRNSRVKVGERIDVWNLRKAIAANPGKIGYVMDPYLDQSVMKATAQQLLDALNNASRKGAGKDTDFLAFDDEHPTLPSTVVDLRGKTAAERLALVKNV